MRFNCALPVMTVILLAYIPCPAQDSIDSAQFGEDADYELVEEIDDLIEEVQASPENTFWIEHLHPATVHFPIAWLVLLILVEVGPIVLGRPIWHTAGFYILVVTVVSMFPSLISGLLLADRLAEYGETSELLELHRNLNFLVAAVTVTALVVRGRLKTPLSSSRRAIYLVLLSLATVTVLFAAYLGGQMVHG